jgi:SAM-dependent methyltransferase
MTKKTMISDNDLKATPELEDFAHKYTEEGSGKVGGKLIDNYFQNVAWLLQTAKLPTNRPLQAIELGCGEGFSTQRLAKILPANAKLHASEYVAALVPKAKALNPKVKVTQESVYELKHKDNTFDVIFLLEVLEHLDYPDKALAEIARVLKPDGVLILGVPREYLWCALNLARGKYVTRFGNTIGHLNHWTTHTLKRYMAKHFGTVEATRTPLPWTVVRAKKR